SPARRSTDEGLFTARVKLDKTQYGAAILIYHAAAEIDPVLVEFRRDASGVLIRVEDRRKGNGDPCARSGSGKVCSHPTAIHPQPFTDRLFIRSDDEGDLDVRIDAQLTDN